MLPKAAKIRLGNVKRLERGLSQWLTAIIGDPGPATSLRNMGAKSSVGIKYRTSLLAGQTGARTNGVRNSLSSADCSPLARG